MRARRRMWIPAAVIALALLAASTAGFVVASRPSNSLPAESIRFQLNLQRVTEAGLKASAKLSSVARLVTTRHGQ